MNRQISATLPSDFCVAYSLDVSNSVVVSVGMPTLGSTEYDSIHWGRCTIISAYRAYVLS